MARVSFWNPPEKLPKADNEVLKLLQRTGKFFAFLRAVRHRPFDDATQQALGALYETENEEGRPSLPPRCWRP
jgi:hypothetical protein